MIDETSTANDAALPDEDAFVLPKAWRRFVQPRRGSGAPRRLAIDSGAGTVFRVWQGPRVREYLAHEANERYAAAGRAFLDGGPDVLGAAAVLTIARSFVSPERAVAREVFDMAAAEHGLPFAAAALAESLAVEIAPTGSGERVALVRRSISSTNWSLLDHRDEVEEIRMHFASASDEEYASIVSALKEVRTDPAGRFAVSLLVPSERAWMDEVCEEHRAHQGNRSGKDLLLKFVTTPEQLECLEPSSMRFFWVRTAQLADLLDRLGPAALPVIERCLEGHLDSDEKKTVYRALAVIPTDAAFALLADRLADPVAMAFALEAAARFPQRTLRTIADRLPGASPADAERYAALLHADPVLLHVALPLQDARVKEAVQSLVGAEERLPAVPDEAVPGLLLAPPWEKADTKATVVKGLTPPAIERVEWAEGEREAWAELPMWPGPYHGEPDWAEEAERFDERGSDNQAIMLCLAPEAIALELLPRWNTGSTYLQESRLQRVLARFGDAAAAQVAAAAATHVDLSDTLLPISGLAAARYAADALVRLKTRREFALEWLDRHAEDAAALLVPDALGTAKRRRTAAETALCAVAVAKGADLVRKAAASYGEEAAAAIAALVDLDPLAPVGVPVPIPGGWAVPAALPQVMLAGDAGALPDAAVRNLIVVLALGTPEYDYPGVKVLAETCDRASLERFSLALFERWVAAGGPPEDSWALTQLAHFGGDDTVRTLAPLIARWPGENQHQRAVKGLRVLGAIGSDAALRAVNGIAEKARFDAIVWEAHEQIRTVAAQLGLSTDQLADRLVPDFGLREADALVLDYGPRRFRVGFDESLRPFATDEDGKPRKTLPKPGAKDDKALADAAYKRFALLRKELRTVAADQVKRLERAMVEGRTWTTAEFDEHFVRHPLVWQLARRLVWRAATADGAVTFRLAEDRTVTGVEDDAIALAPEAAIGLVHPVHLGDELAAWAEVFADYELVQPFPQLARPVMAFTEEERSTGRLTRFENVTVPVGKILGLVSRGWMRAAPEGGGVEPGVSCGLGALRILVELSPGISVGAVDMHPEQTLHSVVVSGRERYGWGRSEPRTGFEAEPVAASEALAALASLTWTG
ncbi:DUF4132 domain-containing protein [Glycomyces paridis]|uniref:DUF4132 domain-containing protein n=1 Tax=Glycomyces paridis TaxID=2126555 RepID=A0A4S8PMG5_9ACTN|nr:DUF4132 domain-containing protein [Glycomyces paridis]THV30832.1 DUF4132 domain-containing protein [Glycomyces paridis]